MASVNVQQVIDSPANLVWDIIADFGGVFRILDPQKVKSSEADGNEIGAIRKILMADDSVIEERIEWKDEASRRLIYSILGDCILPVKEYLATAKVTEIDQATCQIDWQSTFLPIGPAEDAEQVMQALYLGGIQRIQALLSS